MVIDAKEVKIIDINSEYYGVKADRLMENAGSRAASYVLEYITETMGQTPKDTKVLVVCGIGNNGGDGLVAARYLAPKCQVTVVICGKNMGDLKTKLTKMNYAKLKEVMGSEKIYFLGDIGLEKLEKYITSTDIIIDAMLGVGLKGNLRPPYSQIVDMINMHSRGLGITVISLDIPTGFGTDKCISPKVTLTFHDVKTGMTSDRCGIIEIIDIGVPREATVFVSKGELLLYPDIKNTLGHGNTHKGERGRVLVVGGGAYIGAPILTAKAALRTGADLAYICTSRDIALGAVQSVNDIIALPLELSHDAENFGLFKPENIDSVLNYIKRYRIDAICFGNGIGSHENVAEFVAKFIDKYIKNIDDMPPIVIDADALKTIGTLLKNGDDIRFHSKCVITPHLGEYNTIVQGLDPTLRLDRESIATIDYDAMKYHKVTAIQKIKTLAKNLGVTVLLKSRFDIIADAERYKINKTGNIGMSVGGTGDVLSGIVGALLAMGLTPFDAARLGAYMSGYAGDAAWAHKRFGLIATDIIDYIPRIFFEIDPIISTQK